MRLFFCTLIIFFFSFVLKGQVITTMAGTGIAGHTGDNGPAILAKIFNPFGGVFDSRGNYYFVQTAENIVSKIDTGGIISTVAGTGSAGYNGDSILATNAQLNTPTFVIADTNNNIYIYVMDRTIGYEKWM